MVSPEVGDLIAAARRPQGAFPLGRDFSAGGGGAAVRRRSGRIYTGICLDLAYGFTPFEICYASQPPHSDALLGEGKALPDVVHALLLSELRGITVHLGYWDE
jgi:hypothetical protein